MKNFVIGYNLYQNINTTRYKLYSMMLGHAASERRISEEKLLKFGDSISVSKRYVRNEIIGCLYANFLTIKGQGLYVITDRAIRDFQLYRDDAKYKTCEATYTLDIRKKDIKLSFFTLDTVPGEAILSHKGQGWSWNKSLRRLMFTTRDSDLLCNAIRNSIKVFEPNFLEFKGGFEDLIEVYGRRRKTYGDYSMEFNFPGKFESATFLEFKKIYLQLVELCEKPVDWGGKAFKSSDLEGPRSGSFISEAIGDGMIRPIEGNAYSLTGHAALIINSALHNYEKTRVSLIVRKIKNDFVVLIADNTLYSKAFIDHLSGLGFSQGDGWYRSKPFFNLPDATDTVESVVSAFVD